MSNLGPKISFTFTTSHEGPGVNAHAQTSHLKRGGTKNGIPRGNCVLEYTQSIFTALFWQSSYHYKKRQFFDQATRPVHS